MSFKIVTICHRMKNYFFLAAFIFTNSISQNSLGWGLCQNRVGLAHPHPHARDGEYFTVGFPRPAFHTCLPASQLLPPADRAPADRFSFTGKSRKQLKLFGFMSRSGCSQQPGETGGGLPGGNGLSAEVWQRFFPADTTRLFSARLKC